MSRRLWRRLAPESRVNRLAVEKPCEEVNRLARERGMAVEEVMFASIHSAVEEASQAGRPRRRRRPRRPYTRPQEASSPRRAGVRAYGDAD